MRNREGRYGTAEHTAACTLILIGIHAAVLFAVLFFCEVKYEVSDDFMMELIASGAFNGKPDAHLMFCSYLWGLLLNFFYRLWPGISWYLVLQIAVAFLSFCAVSYYLAHTVRFSAGLFFTVLLAAFFARDLYLLPQFTKTAAAAIAGGGCLFVWGLFHRKPGGSVLGGIVIALGCLLRHNALYAVGIYLLFYVIFETACFVRQNRAGCLARLARIYGVGLLLLCGLFVLRWCNNRAYQTDEDYRYFMSYSYARALTVDYPLPDYETCAEELEEIGISQNDYALLRAWMFADRDVFSLERMQQVRSIVDGCRPVYLPTLRDVLRRFRERRMLFYPGTVCCLILALISLLLSRKRFLAAVAAGVVTLSLMFYFLYAGHAVYRVEFGYLYASAMLILYTLPPRGRERLPGLRLLSQCIPQAGGEVQRAERADRTGLCLCVLAVLLAASQVRAYLPDESFRSLSQEEYRTYIDGIFDLSWDYLPEKYTRSVNRRDIRPEFLQEVQEHPENLYLLDFNTTIQSLYFDFSPFESFPAGALHNMVYLGGVTVNHPVIRETLAEWGIGRELPGLLNEGVYFVSNNTSDQVLTYLREHCDAGAQKTLYKTLDGYQIWKYSSSAAK